MIIKFDEILEIFEFLDDWEDWYKYFIDLGKEFFGFQDEDWIEVNKVCGCVFQVWLIIIVDCNDVGDVVLIF